MRRTLRTAGRDVLEKGLIFAPESRHFPARAASPALAVRIRSRRMRLLFGDCGLDPARRELSRGGEPVHIEPQVFDLLLHLIRNRDHVVSKDELLSAVWQGRIVSESTLSNRINAARSAIGDSGRRQQLIRTIARKGLRFVGEVEHEPIAAKLPDDATDRGSDGRPAIAVLPFANLSDDPAQDYFSDGITEDIITDLSRWHQLAVRSRSASFRYRGVAADLGRMARELNVRYIVEGSVRRRGERIRINAQLIDTGTGSHVWADRFDSETSDVFKVQDEVVQTIVGTLVGRVRAADAERARRKPPASLAAYECVLQGNALPWSDAKAAAEAIRLFEQAIEIDPGYGFAHALLAVMRCRQWGDDLGGSDTALNEAYRLAKRAVELTGSESTCFSILSQVCLLRRSFDLALQHMRRAIEINATNQWNTADMGLVLSYVGRAEEAIAWFKRAKEIDPFFDPPWYCCELGRTHMMLRRYDQALAEFERSSARPYRIAAYMAGCHARLGTMDRARALAAQCLEEKPGFTIGRWVAKEPFKDPADAAHLVGCLRAAGLPE
jgi:adenylate cyclase